MIEPVHVLIVGMTQSGKTTFTLRLLLNSTVACRFIFDDMPGRKSFAYKLRAQQCFTEQQCEAALASRWVIFNPSRMFPDDYAAAFDWFCNWVFHCAQRSPGLKLLTVDELWRWADARSIPRGLRLCTQAGLEYGVQLVTATQEPHRVNSSIVGQAGELVCFRLQEPKAWECIAALGADVSTVKNLPIGSFVSYYRTAGTQLAGKLF
jgi:hypothetical protein